MSDETSRSCIKTEIRIPAGVVMMWLAARFPEIAQDAKLKEAHFYTHSEGVKFIVEHTVQPIKPAGPILLGLPPADDDDPPDRVTERFL